MTEMTDPVRQAFANPLVGRPGDEVLHWKEPPWAYGLSFNR
jgi:hypothetical protein